MEQIPLLTDRQGQLFRDDFFGELVVEIRQKEFRAYWPHRSLESVPWVPWRVVSRSGSLLRVQFAIEGVSVDRDIMLDEDCYRVRQPGRRFGEWFCRQPQGRGWAAMPAMALLERVGLAVPSSG